MNAYQNADRSVALYDSYIFASVGRSFDSNKADLLAFNAAIDCEIAAKDKTLNQTTRNYYKEQQKEFAAIAA